MALKKTDLEHFEQKLLDRQREYQEELKALESEGRSAGDPEVRDTADDAATDSGRHHWFSRRAQSFRKRWKRSRARSNGSRTALMGCAFWATVRLSGPDWRRSPGPSIASRTRRNWTGGILRHMGARHFKKGFRSTKFWQGNCLR